MKRNQKIIKNSKIYNILIIICFAVLFSFLGYSLSLISPTFQISVCPQDPYVTQICDEKTLKYFPIILTIPLSAVVGSLIAVKLLNHLKWIIK
jgi:hypothetical protein